MAARFFFTDATGVKVSFFGPGGSRRGMPTGRLGGEPALNAAWAFRNGVPEQDALKMLTLNAAEMFDMEAHIGSIDVGKDADFGSADTPEGAHSGSQCRQPSLFPGVFPGVMR